MNDLKKNFPTMRKLKFPFSELRTHTCQILYISILQLTTNQAELGSRYLNSSGAVAAAI